MDTGPCFNDPHPANKRVDMALVDVAATSIVVVGLISKGLGANALTGNALTLSRVLCTPVMSVVPPWSLCGDASEVRHSVMRDP
jgi:hypothetical protein